VSGAGGEPGGGAGVSPTPPGRGLPSAPGRGLPGEARPPAPGALLTPPWRSPSLSHNRATRSAIQGPRHPSQGGEGAPASSLGKAPCERALGGAGSPPREPAGARRGAGREGRAVAPYPGCAGRFTRGSPQRCVALPRTRTVDLAEDFYRIPDPSCL